jgi:2-oxoisovalerate dehydrogenase E1 component
VPVAAGLALAAKLRERGSISTVFIGDGTLGEGSIYEAFNLAARWELPLLVVLEDNGMAQSTRQAETFAGSVPARAEGFGLGYASADTWDWKELHAVAGRVVDEVRSRGRPFLLHVRTYRLKAHSKGDDTRPRPEVEPYEVRDPVTLFAAEPAHAGLVEEAREAVGAAVAAAESAQPAVYRPPEAPLAAPPGWEPATAGSERVVHALNRCLARALEGDGAVILIGEDIESPYGGAFKATQGLSTAFPGRVRNTPISEAGIVGMGSGLALAGRRPVVEIMFGDFLGLAFDQLVNHAAKFERMYANQVTVDLVVRTPMGGRRGYGPTHSQTLDRHFLGVPGLRVLALNNLLPPSALYEPLFSGHPGPTLVLENKGLYGTHLRGEFPPGFAILSSDERFPTAWLRPDAETADLTLLGYGGMSEMLATAAERLFIEHDLVVQLLCPMQIHPFSVGPMLPVLRRAPRLLIVEEGQGFAGFGAEVAAQLAEAAPAWAVRIGRLAPPEDVIPSSATMEKAMLPSLDAIVARAAGMCA